MTAREEIRTFVAELLRRKADKQPFNDSASLILAGRLESIDAVEIVMFLERRFGVDFAAIGFDQTQLDSVDLILELAEQAPRARSANQGG